MRQAYKLGVFIRKTYVESLSFLPPTLEDGRHEHFSSQFVSESGGYVYQCENQMWSFFPKRSSFINGDVSDQ